MRSTVTRSGYPLNQFATSDTARGRRAQYSKHCRIGAPTLLYTSSLTSLGSTFGAVMLDSGWMLSPLQHPPASAPFTRRFDAGVPHGLLRARPGRTHLVVPISHAEQIIGAYSGSLQRARQVLILSSFLLVFVESRSGCAQP
ncbi:hypothetical protein Hte_008009 [Hypoxylon texense]